MMAAILGLVLALGVIWVVGYILIVVLAPGVFVPRSHEAAVALLVGLCAAAVAPLLPGNIIQDPLWFDRTMRWTVPLVIAVGGLIVLVRLRHRPQTSLGISWRTMRLRSIPGVLGRWASAIVLLVAATALVVHHPSPPATIEMYGVRTGDRVRVSITSLPRRQSFVLMVTSGPGGHATRVALKPSAGHTTTVTVAVRGTAWIDLYHATGNIAASQPLRSLAFPVTHARSGKAGTGPARHGVPRTPARPFAPPFSPTGAIVAPGGVP